MLGRSYGVVFPVENLVQQRGIENLYGKRYFDLKFIFVWVVLWKGYVYLENTFSIKIKIYSLKEIFGLASNYAL